MCSVLNSPLSIKYPLYRMPLARTLESPLVSTQTQSRTARYSGALCIPLFQSFYRPSWVNSFPMRSIWSSLSMSPWGPHLAPMAWLSLGMIVVFNHIEQLLIVSQFHYRPAQLLQVSAPRCPRRRRLQSHCPAHRCLQWSDIPSVYSVSSIYDPMFILLTIVQVSTLPDQPLGQPCALMQQTNGAASTPSRWQLLFSSLVLRYVPSV